MESKNLLSVHKISKSFGIKTLYKDITFGIHEGEKIAIIAKNGAGKTTLMRTLIDPSNADTGDVVFRNGIKIRYLSQQPAYARLNGKGSPLSECLPRLLCAKSL